MADAKLLQLSKLIGFSGPNRGQSFLGPIRQSLENSKLVVHYQAYRQDMLQDIQTAQGLLSKVLSLFKIHHERSYHEGKQADQPRVYAMLDKFSEKFALLEKSYKEWGSTNANPGDVETNKQELYFGMSYFVYLLAELAKQHLSIMTQKSDRFRPNPDQAKLLEEVPQEVEQLMQMVNSQPVKGNKPSQFLQLTKELLLGSNTEGERKNRAQVTQLTAQISELTGQLSQVKYDKEELLRKYSEMESTALTYSRNCQYLQNEITRQTGELNSLREEMRQKEIKSEAQLSVNRELALKLQGLQQENHNLNPIVQQQKDEITKLTKQVNNLDSMGKLLQENNNKLLKEKSTWQSQLDAVSTPTVTQTNKTRRI